MEKLKELINNYNKYLEDSKMYYWKQSEKHDAYSEQEKVLIAKGAAYKDCLLNFAEIVEHINNLK